MNCTQPLVRSIACWAVSRFSNWLADQYDTNEEGRKRFFEPVLFGLLKRLLDSNRRVQESACTAFIILGESASTRLVPYIYPILTQTNGAFALYRRKNRLILYDALGTLADAVGSQLNRPQFIYLLMPPLISKWNELSDKDTDLFPLLEVKITRFVLNVILFDTRTLIYLCIVPIKHNSCLGTRIYTIRRTCLVKMRQANLINTARTNACRSIPR